MRKKLIRGVLGIVLLILVIIAGVQVITHSFRLTANKLIIEYHELNALQEVKMSLVKLSVTIEQISSDHSIVSNGQLGIIVDELKLHSGNLNKVITDEHDQRLVKEFSEISKILYYFVDDLVTYEEQYSEEVHLKINAQIKHGIEIANDIIDETEVEIKEVEKKSQTAIRHGTFSVVGVGLIIMIFLFFGGVHFVRILTRPIQDLVVATQRISDGERQFKVKVSSQDEFKQLADSFNSMLEALEKTTVSEEYLKNIINNLQGILIVTDKNCRIKSINNLATQILGFNEAHLISQDLGLIFKSNERNIGIGIGDTIDLDREAAFFRTKEWIYVQDGSAIPVMVACTVLKTFKGEAEGLILVAHDLTEKKAYEMKIDQMRKERLIVINEAQEEERMRIATDIHDGLGQMLTAIAYSIEEMRVGDPSEDSYYHSLRQQIDATIQEAKSLSHNLIPIVLKDYGLVPAIQNMLDKANQVTEIHFELYTYDMSHRLDPKLEKMIYRICQESLSNIIKHSQARTANFQLFRSAEAVVITIEDDGVGFDVKAIEDLDRNNGIGLISIRERVAAFNGVFTIDSIVNKGTELLIEIPCRKKNTNELNQNINS